MTTPDASFEAVALPHLDAAYNLACWLVRDRSAAEDIVQDAMLRALKYFSTYKGTNGRAWILQIVRNAAWQHVQSAQKVSTVSIDNENEHVDEMMAAAVLLDTAADDPVTMLIKQRENGYLSDLIKRLPIDLRECLVLRELEDLSYNEIAQVAGIPVGTVMSRLWRARRFLIDAVQQENGQLGNGQPEAAR